jgi:hypothetical protein
MNNESQRAKHLYKVEIGHNSVMVESGSPEDAIRAARTKLSLEMPRLWDIIQKLSPEKFNVSMVY